jgi:hypothetical protein
MRDPESVWMAAFTAEDPNDRDAFDAHMSKVRTAPDGTMRAVIRGGRLVGSIASIVRDGDTEITYWIDRSVWGQGVASQALALFLDVVSARLCMLAPPATTSDRSGFCSGRASRSSAQRFRTQTARGTEIEETILRLG